MMDNQKIAKQMIQFNKTAFDNSFNAMTMVYEQNEKMVNTFLSQATWLPEEGKKAIEDWVSAYRNGCDDFKKLVDDNYAKVEAFFNK
jgi:polyhydroxyalkanoate synthesis regulator phasin